MGWGFPFASIGGTSMCPFVDRFRSVLDRFWFVLGPFFIVLVRFGYGLVRFGSFWNRFCSFGSVLGALRWAHRLDAVRTPQRLGSSACRSRENPRIITGD